MYVLLCSLRLVELALQNRVVVVFFFFLFFVVVVLLFLLAADSVDLL